MAPGFQPREFVNRVVWKWTNDSDLTVVYHSFEHPDYPHDPATHVRAYSEVYWSYEALPLVFGIPQTKVTYVLKMELKGAIPPTIIYSRGGRQLSFLSNMRHVFDQSCEVDATVPVASVCADGESLSGTFTFPMVPNSDLPGLLGLGAMVGKCVLDMTSTPMKLHFVGKGRNEFRFSEGTRTFNLEQSPSGHLMLPIGEFQQQDRAAPSLDRTTLNLATMIPPEGRSTEGTSSSSASGSRSTPE